MAVFGAVQRGYSARIVSGRRVQLGRRSLGCRRVSLGRGETIWRASSTGGEDVQQGAGVGREEAEDPAAATTSSYGGARRREGEEGEEGESRNSGDSLAQVLNQREVPDASIAKQMGVSPELFEAVMDLPGTTDVRSMRSRLLSLARWNAKLQKGTLPRPEELTWPEEPFRSKFIETLRKLGMARFTQKHPKLLGSLMKQFMQLAKDFEIEAMQNQDASEDSKQRKNDRPPPSSSPSETPPDMESEEGGGPTEGNEGMEGEDGEGERNASDDTEVKMEDAASGESPEDDTEEVGDGDFAEELAQKMLDKFEEDWAPAMEALEAAEEAFDDVDPLIEGTEGFDAAQSVWHHTGWKQLASLRKKLENLRELRDLVRSLGRGGGKGPIRRAPQQIFQTGMPLGVIRSEESPEETRGLTRSGDLSRMLPIEARLLASSRRAENAVSRRLFMARRAERMLLSYERAGWVEDQPSRVTDRLELRPASEMGPIIVCLDTSASMMGPRETVAKSLTLECMRGAIRQQRRCLVYAFSGPGDVQELELGVGPESISSLLNFLTMSFSGGTDVDAPLACSLGTVIDAPRVTSPRLSAQMASHLTATRRLIRPAERLGREEWNMADILMVTDGEIPPPNEDIIQKLNLAKEELGLTVHGLLVGQRVTEPMEAICSDPSGKETISVFRSWGVVDDSVTSI